MTGPIKKTHSDLQFYVPDSQLKCDICSQSLHFLYATVTKNFITYNMCSGGCLQEYVVTRLNALSQEDRERKASVSAQKTEGHRNIITEGQKKNHARAKSL